MVENTVGKRETYSLGVISPSPTVFSIDLYCRHGTSGSPWYSQTVLKNILGLFLQDFVNLNVKSYGIADQKLHYIQIMLNIEKIWK